MHAELGPKVWCTQSHNHGGSRIFKSTYLGLKFDPWPKMMTMVLPCVKSNRAPIAQETRIIQKIQAKQTKMESGNEIKF